jgi:cell division protein FtsW
MLVYPLLGISLMLLVGVFIPGLGLEVKKASRWISLGALTFQPSEVARFAIVLYLAYSLSKKQDRIRIFSIGIAPHVAVLGVFMLLLAFQPDFGSMVILSAVTWVMLFTGGARIIHLLSPLTVLLPALYCYMVSADYRLARLYSFLNPWKYSSNEGFQMINSLMGFGSGGVLGGGIGKGYLKLFYLPEPHTDFIFAVVGEELGLIGVLIILVLYSIIVWRGLLIACRARNTFNQLLAVGLTTAIGLQILVNISVALGLLPTKGLTLPFMSYGGTSLLINMASVGILLNISASGGKQ